MTKQHVTLTQLSARGSGASFVFPYTPESLVRSFEHGPSGPTETIAVTFLLDATDALASGDATASRYGLHPALARLQQLAAEQCLLLSWSQERAVPIQPLASAVNELAFDASLNPIRAEFLLRAVVVTSSTVQAVASAVQQRQAEIERLASLYSAVT